MRFSIGNIGERLSYDSNVYVSNDAGESWLEVCMSFKMNSFHVLHIFPISV